MNSFKCKFLGVGALAWDILSCSEEALTVGNDGIRDIFPPNPFDKDEWTSRN